MLLSSALWPTSRVVAKWLHPAGRRRHGRCNCPGTEVAKTSNDIERPRRCKFTLPVTLLTSGSLMFFFRQTKTEKPTQPTLHSTTSTAESCGAGFLEQLEEGNCSFPNARVSRKRDAGRVAERFQERLPKKMDFVANVLL